MFGFDDVAASFIGSKLAGGSSGGSSAPNPLKAQYGKAGAQYIKLLNAYKAGLPTQLDMLTEYGGKFTDAQAEQYRRATQGYLSTFENDILPASLRSNTVSREAGLVDLAALGPEAYGNIRSINPAQSSLMDALNANAMDQLGLGTVLDPNQLDWINNSVLGEWSNRGLGTSSPAQLAAALQATVGGQDLLQRRQSNALAVAGANQSFYTDPVMRLLGLDTNMNAANSLAAGGGSFTSANPAFLDTNQATSMLGGAYTAKVNQDIASKNNAAAEQAGWMGLGGSALGAGAVLGAALI